jgi:spore coat-associated protein N
MRIVYEGGVGAHTAFAVVDDGRIPQLRYAPIRTPLHDSSNAAIRRRAPAVGAEDDTQERTRVSILTRNKKVAAGVGVAAAAAAAIALGTGTYAAFTATATGPSGTLAAGKMSLVVNGGGATTNLFDQENIFPGQTFDKEITFTNVSPVAGTLSGTETESDVFGSHLKSQMTVSSSCTIDGSGAAAITSDPAVLDSLAGKNAVGAVVVPANGVARCKFTFTFADRTDNDLAQGEKVKVDSSFTLTQKIG